MILPAPNIARCSKSRSAHPLSTLANQVVVCAFERRPLHELVAAHVLGAQPLQGDDTLVLVLAKGTGSLSGA